MGAPGARAAAATAPYLLEFVRERREALLRPYTELAERLRKCFSPRRNGDPRCADAEFARARELKKALKQQKEYAVLGILRVYALNPGAGDADADEAALSWLENNLAVFLAGYAALSSPGSRRRWERTVAELRGGLAPGDVRGRARHLYEFLRGRMSSREVKMLALVTKVRYSSSAGIARRCAPESPSAADAGRPRWNREDPLCARITPRLKGTACGNSGLILDELAGFRESSRDATRGSGSGTPGESRGGPAGGPRAPRARASRDRRPVGGCGPPKLGLLGGESTGRTMLLSYAAAIVARFLDARGIRYRPHSSHACAVAPWEHGLRVDLPAASGGVAASVSVQTCPPVAGPAFAETALQLSDPELAARAREFGYGGGEGVVRHATPEALFAHLLRVVEALR